MPFLPSLTFFLFWPLRIIGMLLFSLQKQVIAAPLHSQLSSRNIQSIGYIDPATDEWSSTLSGVGPLILLVGDRSTKQVLRNVRGISSAFSLAAAPLGLLSVVTSLIRLCGVQHLRAFIGYELEARNAAGMEVTRVNCGGVSAHLSDGYVVRSMAANPASQLVAVSILEGKEEGLREKALTRIRAGEMFERDKLKAGIPDGVANLDWVLHIIIEAIDDEALDAVAETLTECVGLSASARDLQDFKKLLKSSHETTEDNIPQLVDTMESVPRSFSKQRTSQTMSTVSSSGSLPEKNAKISIRETTTRLSAIDEKEDPSVRFWNFTFVSTFDAVSEFTTQAPVSKAFSAGIGVVAFLSIISVHLLALWQNNWVMSIGWMLVMVGYFGIVFGVTLAALIINSSTACIELDTKSSSKKNKDARWREGMVVAVKNTDSMDTTGSSFVSSPAKHQTLETVWIKSISHLERLIASGITVTLVLMFITHYLGLRAIKWWASIGELGICILAAFARSASNDIQPRFEDVDGVKIDKRCMSTGLIRTQTSIIVEGPRKGLDARAYSFRNLGNAPTAGERIAFQTAKLYAHDAKIRTLITNITGMKVQVIREHQSSLNRAVLASFTGGILFKEGIGFPSTQCVLAFRASCASLAAPTSSLARAIMRQPSWTLTKGEGIDIPLGNVYIFAVQSMLDWWTMSEDRNDMGDLQRNLHWPFFLVNLSFFLEILRIGENDEELLQEVERAHDGCGQGDLKVSVEVGAYLKKWACE